MARYYHLVPLPLGVFAEDQLSLVDRAVFGLIYDRWRLSNYTAAGSNEHDTPWYDEIREEFYCVYAHDELARLIGVSEKTIRRSLITLRDKEYIDWRKDGFKTANRYFIRRRLQEYMYKLRKENTKKAPEGQ